MALITAESNKLFVRAVLSVITHCCKNFLREVIIQCIHFRSNPGLNGKPSSMPSILSLFTCRRKSLGDSLVVVSYRFPSGAARRQSQRQERVERVN